MRFLMTQQEWDSWLATRPKSIQSLVAEFPYGITLPTCGGQVHVIGWAEDDGLLVSEVNPYDDLYGSREKQFIIPACHARKNKRGALH